MLSQTRTKLAYALGCYGALRSACIAPMIRQKTAAAVSPEKYTFLEKLLGGNVRNVTSRELERIMASGEIGAITQGAGPERMSSVREFVRRLLQGVDEEIPLIKELEQNRELAKQVDIVDAIRQGRRAIAKEQATSRNARLLAGGVGVGVPWTYSKSPDRIKEKAKEMAPVVGGGALAAAPIVQGLRSGALRIPETLDELTGKKEVGDLQKLVRDMRRGDIILTGDPTMYGNKAAIIAAGSDPHAYHAAVATGPVTEGRINVVHGAPDLGSATHGSYPIWDRDFVVKRFKDPALAEEFMKNVDAAAGDEGMLGSIFGEGKRPKMYDMPGAINSALKDLLPESVRKVMPESSVPSSTFCSSMVGGACPVPLKPGVKPNEVLPHHIQTSELLSDVGHFYQTRPRAVALKELGMRAVPFALRGALGLGLGYGAYKGLKALTDDTPKPIKDIKKWFA